MFETDSIHIQFTSDRYVWEICLRYSNRYVWDSFDRYVWDILIDMFEPALIDIFEMGSCWINLPNVYCSSDSMNESVSNISIDVMLNLAQTYDIYRDIIFDVMLNLLCYVESCYANYVESTHVITCYWINMLSWI